MSDILTVIDGQHFPADNNDNTKMEWKSNIWNSKN